MKYVIHSKSERGFWNDEIGWVYDIESASVFTDTNQYFPLSAGMDAEWITVKYDEN